MVYLVIPGVLSEAGSLWFEVDILETGLWLEVLLVWWQIERYLESLPNTEGRRSPEMEKKVEFLVANIQIKTIRNIYVLT